MGDAQDARADRRARDDVQTSLVNFPLRCLSRATYYTGRYAHNHGRMGALLGVDDMVQRVVKVLRRTGEYRDTVIVFTSDNGWILGEHRLRDPVTQDGRAAGVRYVPYEGSSRGPLLVAGPGFPQGGP